MRLRTLDSTVLFVLVLLTVLAPSSLGAEVSLVSDEGLAVIVTPDEPDGHEREAAELLREYIEKSTLARLPLKRERDVAEGPFPRLYVGRGAFVDRSVGDRLDPLSPDGFILKAEGRSVIVAGRTSYGTWCAATEFLRRHCGVRWYQPGPLWEVVKKQRELRLPVGETVVDPSFISRHHSGHRGHVEHRWLRRQGSVHRYDFHHAAARWTHPEAHAKYKDKREFWSLLDGRRMIPGAHSVTGWQVCMTNPEVLDAYARMADEYFARHPQMLSFSVSPNDGANFCECANCRKLYSAPNPDEDDSGAHSRLVFHMVNGVARRIAQTWPDKKVGILAYSSYREPAPGMKVEPNVVVYQVGCRSTYGKAEQRDRYEKNFARWKAAGVRHFGMYEWHHGSFFTVPPLYLHLLAQAMRFGVAQGAAGWYSEDYPAWGLQGPAHWIVARLLWDVDRDVDALLDEYCDDLFGGAAKTMRAYFRRCEEQWTAHAGGGGMGSASQFDAYPPAAMEELRALLDRAEEQTANEEPAGTRVRFFSAAFGLGERMAPRHYAAVDAIERIEKGDLKGAMEAAAAAADPGRDPMLYMRLKLDPLPLAYYYKSETVDRHFNAAESRLLQARIFLVDRIVDALGPKVYAQERVTPRGFQALLQEAIRTALPVAEGDNIPFLMTELRNMAGKHVTIPRAEGPIEVDGELEEAAWGRASPREGFVSHGAGRPARHRTVFRMLHDGARLYLGVECYQNMTRPKATAGSRDGKTWLDDSVELHVNLPGAEEPKDMLVVIVNVDGTVFDMKRGDARWDADLEVATKREADRWVLECSIPFPDMGIDPERTVAIRLNVVRNACGAYTGNEIATWFPSYFANMDLNIRGWGFLEN